MINRWVYFALISVVLILDQASKYWITRTFTQFDVWQINDFFNIRRVHNSGSAFGLFSDFGISARYFLTIIAIIISAILLYYLVTLPKRAYLTLFALALILAGALGNVIDRIQYGFVIDFLDFHYQTYAWPVFNVADIAISCGIILLLITQFKSAHD